MLYIVHGIRDWYPYIGGLIALSWGLLILYLHIKNESLY